MSDRKVLLIPSNHRAFIEAVRKLRPIIKIYCPVCYKPMRIKMNKETGELFLGCSDYPKCPYSISYADVKEWFKYLLESGKYK